MHEFKSEIVRGCVVLAIISGTAGISYFNKTFAETQAGLIVSGVVAGYFGVSDHLRNTTPRS